jgi:phosphatidylglycerol:prolipoprotein diacylglycerol transferase
MYPRLFTIPAFDLLGRHLGPISLPTYGVLLAIAFLAGLWVVGREAKRSGLDVIRVTDLAIYALIGGLVGARLLLVIVDWQFYSKNWSELWGLVQSGGVFYGGLIGGILVGAWYIRRHQMAIWPLADVLAPGVVLGQAIGRLGCLAAGCCFGKPTTVAWAVTFRDMYAAQRLGTPVDIPVHPTQIYESIATILIFAFLIWLARRKRFHGQVAMIYVMLYSVARYLIEYFRGDSARGFVLEGRLSTSQLISIVLFAAAAATLPYLARKQRVDAASAPAAPPAEAAS